MNMNPADKSQGMQVNQHVVGVQGVTFLPASYPLQTLSQLLFALLTLPPLIKEMIAMVEK